MAITLASGSNGQLDFGDLAILAGQTALSFFLILKPSSLGTSPRVFTQWGPGGGSQAFLSQLIGAELGFVVSDGAATYFGMQTTTLSMTTGTTYRILITIAFGSPPVIHIYVNGTDMPLSSWIGSGNVTQSIDAVADLNVGFETLSSAVGVDGDYSEFAIWQRVLSSTEANQLTNLNQYPSCPTPNGIIYLPMNTTADLTDRWSSVTAVLTDGSSATHPAMVACGASPNPFVTVIGAMRF